MCHWRTPFICLSLVCLTLHSGCAESDEPQTVPAPAPVMNAVSIDGSFPRLLGDQFDGRAVGDVALDWSYKPEVRQQGRSPDARAGSGTRLFRDAA